MKVIKPPRLRRGDNVGFISPSNSINSRKTIYKKAINNFCKSLDLEPKLGKYVFDDGGYTASSTVKRLDDFHRLLKDNSIRAIFWTAGGDSAVDLVDTIDYQLIKRNPKVIAGISDFSTLSLPILLKTGLINYHGIEIQAFESEDMSYEIASIKKLLFEADVGVQLNNPHWKDYRNNPTKYKRWLSVKKGKASGALLGVNCSSILSLIGSKYGPNFEDSLLVIDFYKRHKQHIYMALRVLHLSQVFRRIKGMIIGHCVGIDEDIHYNRADFKSLVLEATKEYSFPIMQIGEIGHYVENMIIPIGAKATMDATNLRFSIDEPVVS